MAEIIQYPNVHGDMNFMTPCALRTRVHPSDRFVMLFSGGLAALARLDLTAREYRVILGLASLVEYGSRVTVTQADLGKASGLGQPTVSRTLKRLVDRGVIRKTRTGAWDLGPGLVWKGRLGDRKRLMARGQ